MNEEDKKSIITLENFIKKIKGDKIVIKQPKKLIYEDIFDNEEKRITLEKEEKTNDKNKDKLKAIKQPHKIKFKKYNVVKESIVFQELDSKKSILNITNSKDEYNNYLFNSMINNNKINSEQNMPYTKKTSYIRKKTSINLNELYEMKLKNVRKIKYYNYFCFIE